MSELDPDPLPLRSIPVPAEVSRVEGCDCGGQQWHRQDCTIFSLPYETAQGAVDASLERERAFTDRLNARLRAALAPDSGTSRQP